MNTAYTLRARMQRMQECIEELREQNATLLAKLESLEQDIDRQVGPSLGGDAREVASDLSLEGYRRLNAYPSDGSTVRGLVHTADRKIVIIYEDDSYLIVEKVGGKS